MQSAFPCLNLHTICKQTISLFIAMCSFCYFQTFEVTQANTTAFKFICLKFYYTKFSNTASNSSINCIGARMTSQKQIFCGSILDFFNFHSNTHTHLLGWLPNNNYASKMAEIGEYLPNHVRIHSPNLNDECCQMRFWTQDVEVGKFSEIAVVYVSINQNIWFHLQN